MDCRASSNESGSVNSQWTLVVLVCWRVSMDGCPRREAVQGRVDLEVPEAEDVGLSAGEGGAQLLEHDLGVLVARVAEQPVVDDGQRSDAGRVDGPVAELAGGVISSTRPTASARGSPARSSSRTCGRTASSRPRIAVPSSPGRR